MRFTIEQRFDAPPDDVLRAYTDPALYASLAGLHHISAPDVLEVRAGDPVTVVRARYRFIASLPSAATRVIDPAKLTWVDETAYDRTARTSTTQLTPDHYGDRFRGIATARFEPDGEDGGATVRRIRGEVTVRMPLVGGKVEGAIVEGLEEHLAAEAEAVTRHLRS